MIKDNGGEVEATRWCNYTITVALVVYTEQLKNSVLLPEESVCTIKNRAIIRMNKEERWQMFQGLLDLHLVHRSVDRVLTEEEQAEDMQAHQIESQEPYTENQLHHALNVWNRLKFRLSTDKKEIEEYVQREKQEQHEVKQSRVREEDGLIAENRILSIEVVNRDDSYRGKGNRDDTITKE